MSRIGEEVAAAAREREALPGDGSAREAASSGIAPASLPEQGDAEGRAEPGAGSARRSLPLLLFLATLLTTTWAGVQGSESAWQAELAWRQLHWVPGIETPRWWAVGEVWFEALGFSLSLVAIFLSHEMGHYLTARRRGVPASLPYFIPFLPPVGTLGAVIRMEGHRMTARTMMRVAAFGPFAGAVVAVPVLFWGLSLSDIRPIPTDDTMGVTLGDSLVLMAAQRVFFPDVPAGSDVFLHPIAFAGWVGCMLTAWNLIPLGQLDGGHVAYAMWAERFNARVKGIWWGVVVAGTLVFPGWLVLALIARLWIGLEHPPLVTDGRVRGVDRWIGWGAVLLFLVTFTPVPQGAPIITQLLGLY